MGFFEKLFGTSKEVKEQQPKLKVRAQFKDSKYFDNEINRFEKIIDDVVNSVKENNNPSPFSFWSISSKYLRILELNYSLGEKVGKLKKYYNLALDYYIKGWDEKDATYEDLLNMISIGILIDIPKSELQKLVNYVEKTDANKNLKDWHPDGLLWFLLNSIEETEKNYGTVLIPEIYGDLFQITKLPKPEAEKAIIKYLAKWYKMHKDAPWYNTHLRDKGYKGYWAWEVAAVVKVMGLDDASFNSSPYYPYDFR